MDENDDKDRVYNENRGDHHFPIKPLSIIYNISEVCIFVLGIFTDYVHWFFYLMACIIAIPWIVNLIIKEFCSVIEKWVPEKINLIETSRLIESFLINQLTTFFVFAFIFIFFIFPNNIEDYFPKVQPNLGRIAEYEISTIYPTIQSLNFFVIESKVEPLIENKVTQLLPTLQDSSLESIETEIAPIIEQQVVTLIPTIQNRVLQTIISTRGNVESQFVKSFFKDFSRLLNDNELDRELNLHSYFCGGTKDSSVYLDFQKFYFNNYLNRYPDFDLEDLFKPEFSCSTNILESDITDNLTSSELKVEYYCDVNTERGDSKQENHVLTLKILKPTDARNYYCFSNLSIDGI